MIYLAGYSSYILGGLNLGDAFDIINWADGCADTRPIAYVAILIDESTV